MTYTIEQKVKGIACIAFMILYDRFPVDKGASSGGAISRKKIGIRENKMCASQSSVYAALNVLIAGTLDPPVERKVDTGKRVEV